MNIRLQLPTSSLPNDTNHRFNTMDAQLTMTNIVYMEGFGQIEHCAPKTLQNQTFEFRLPLDQPWRSCGIRRELDHELNEQRFSQRVIIKQNLDKNSDKRRVDALQVRCVGPLQSSPNEHNFNGPNSNNSLYPRSVRSPVESGRKLNHKRSVRINGGGSGWDELPPNFRESNEELLDYSGNVTANGPRPEVRIAVRQSGQQVDAGEAKTKEQLGWQAPVQVQPGTPLELSIYLHGDSSDVYGLLCSQLKVADRLQGPAQEEPMLYDGCSIDPYIFGNFETRDHGKSIFARFRAFKFPDSNYVLFVSRVNVCINQCQPVLCTGASSGFAYGRKRRKRHSDQTTEQLLLNSTAATGIIADRKPINGQSDNQTFLQFPISKPAFEVEMSAVIRVVSARNSAALIQADFNRNGRRLLRISSGQTNSLHRIMHQMPLKSGATFWSGIHSLMIVTRITVLLSIVHWLPNFLQV